MKKVCLGLAVALLLPCGNALAMTLYTSGVEELDASKVRIALADPAKFPSARVRAVAPKAQAGLTYGGQSDSLFSGAIGRADVPFLFVSYQTGHFVYSRTSETLSQFLPSEAFDRKDASDGEAHSPFGTVDYVITTVTEKKSNVTRTCAFWNGLLDGNALIYRGLYCPVGHDATLDDVNAGMNAVVLKTP